MKRLSMIILLIFSNFTYAATERSVTVPISNVTLHRMHSINHAIAAVHNVYLVWVSGLSDGCSKIYIYADKDPYLFSATLAGISSQGTNSVSFYYYIDASTRGPWGDSGACQLTSFSVVN